MLAIFGLSINLTFGFLGLISFGHAAFFGLGAYGAGLLVTKLGLNFWAALVLAPLPAAALGAVVGFASVRVGGAHFAIATLTTAEILRLVTANWIELTRGPLGLIVPRPRIPALEGLGFAFQQYYLAACLAALMLSIELVRRILGSPTGRAWLLIRTSNPLAESLGIATLRERVINIALSGRAGGARRRPLRPPYAGPDRPTSSARPCPRPGSSSRSSAARQRWSDRCWEAPCSRRCRRLCDSWTSTASPSSRWCSSSSCGSGRPVSRGCSRDAGCGRPGRRRGPRPGEKRSGFVRTEPLAAAGLSKRFGGLDAVQDVSVTIRPGELLGIIGPNGAGKTTLLSLLSGFLTPTSGSVRYGGLELTGRNPHRAAAAGLVRTFQHDAVCPTLPVLDNVLAATYASAPHRILAAALRTPAFRARERDRAALAWACLESAGLADRADEIAGGLPYGEQKMLAIAMALACRPRLLLLDEPAAGLNHTEANRLAALLRALRERGLTIAVVDHNLRMMMALCDRILVLDRGRRLAEGTAGEIAADPAVSDAYLGRRRRSEAARAPG